MEGWVEWPFTTCSQHCLIVPCLQISLLEVCTNKRPLIDVVVGVGVQVRIHLRHEDGSADRADFTAVVMIEGMVVHVAMQSAKSIVCKPAE